ncbi:MAG: hypothetical protein WCO44_03470 [Bacteroidota bacterium]
MGNFEVRMVNWKEASPKLKIVNKTLHDLIEPINRHFKTVKQDYFYLMDFKFSERVIKDGQMVALERDRYGNYLHKDKIVLNAGSFSVDKEDDLNRFIEDCGKDSDHPLSVVTKGYVEVYCTQPSAYKLNGSEHEYSFPLNIIETGGLFGVYGSINSIFSDYKENFYGWNAVAGKACILPLIPEPLPNKSHLLYRKKFNDIFPESDQVLTGIFNMTNQLLGNDSFSEILIIPEKYYIRDKDDSPELVFAKHKLKEYLYQVSWSQTKSIREMVWDDKELMLMFKLDNPDFTFHLIKHIANIVNGNAYLLKPVSENDGILFDVFKNLVEKFKSFSDRTGDLLDYTTPIFLHYVKLDKNNPKGLELTHSPSINLRLPPTNSESMRDSIMRQILVGKKISEKLKKNGHDISIQYFKQIPKEKKDEKNKEREKDEKNNDNDFLLGIDKYIDNELTQLYSKYLPQGKSVKLPQTPSLFNSFIQIEKKNW